MNSNHGKDGAAHQALALLREKMTSDDLVKLSPRELNQFKEICHHWAALATTKQSNTAV